MKEDAVMNTIHEIFLKKNNFNKLLYTAEREKSEIKKENSDYL